MDEKTDSTGFETVSTEKGTHEETMTHYKEEAQTLDHINEKKLLLKCDLNIVPILFLLFLCAFVDR